MVQFRYYAGNCMEISSNTKKHLSSLYSSKSVMHEILLRGEPLDFVLNAVFHISRILVECCCQIQGPSTYDVKEALRKILRNDGYKTSQNVDTCYQFR